MAATRCANPDYQSEVDAMMLEYVLYKSIDTHLHFLAALGESQAFEDLRDTNHLVQQAENALRLSEIYDALIALNKANHDADLDPATRRDGQILRFLVQLNSWVLHRVPILAKWVPEPSTSMLKHLREGLALNHLCRRAWLDMQKGSASAGGSRTDFLRNLELSLADHVLPSFMAVSVDLFQISKTPELSPEWMKLAANLIVQAAIEILDAPDLLDHGEEVARDALEECLAWGSLEEYRFEESIQRIFKDATARGFPTPSGSALWRRAKVEDQCLDMFSENDNLANEPQNKISSRRTELVAWERTRKDILQDVLMTFTSIQEAEEETVYGPVELLREKYPLRSLLSEIHDFIAIHWKLLHSTNWHGKPILIQIEEGGIDGLTEEQFEEFKISAGIQDMWDSMLLLEE